MPQASLFVIGGYTPPEGSRKYFGALLVGYYGPEGLLFAGSDECARETNFGVGHLGNTGRPVDYPILQAQAILLVRAIGTPQKLVANETLKTVADSCEAAGSKANKP